MRTTIADSSEQCSKRAQDNSSSVGDIKRSRIPVLHLLNGVGDSSIMSIVVDQINHFGDQDFDWHIGGLNGVAADEPFSRMNAKVVDFSKVAKGPIQLLRCIRTYVADHHIQLIHTHTPRTTMVAAMALTGRRTKLVTTKHLHAVSQERAAWGWLFTLVDRLAIYMPDQIVAVSNDVRRRILASPGMHPDRVSVVQNAVDIETYDVPTERDSCRSEFGITPESPVLGFAGRLTKQKRIDLLLAAFDDVLKRYPTARLLIAGDGEEKEKQQSFARQLGVSDHVIWAGHRRDMPRLLAAMDVYVQSSVNEGLSLSLLQAMAARTPVVATDVGGTREVVNERTGILISPGSSSRIAKAIVDLLDHPEATSKRVETARQHVNEHFSVRRQMEGYLAIYQKLLAP